MHGDTGLLQVFETVLGALMPERRILHKAITFL